MKHWPPLQDSCPRGFARETGEIGEEKEYIGEMGEETGKEKGEEKGKTGGKSGCALAAA